MARSLNSNRRFVQVPSVTRPLLFLGAVVVATALVTGGVGIRSLGSDHYGGRNYFYILAAIMGYFAFTSHRIPTSRAGLYIGMFFLSGLTSLIGDLAFAAGPHFYFLTAIFVPDTGLDQTPGVIGGSTALVRLAALMGAGSSVYTWLTSFVLIDLFRYSPIRFFGLHTNRIISSRWTSSGNTFSSSCNATF